jgi:hypothetical protein
MNNHLAKGIILNEEVKPMSILYHRFDVIYNSYITN